MVLETFSSFSWCNTTSNHLQLQYNMNLQLMSIYNAMCELLSFIILIKHGYGSIYPNYKYQYIFRDIRIKMRILPPHFLCEKVES